MPQQQTLGLLATKIGMTQVYEGDNVVPVTVLQLDHNRVVGKRTMEKDGYTAIQVGASKKRRPNKADKGAEGDGGVPAHIAEFRVTNDVLGNYEKNAELTAALFDEVAYVDVQSVSKGKGFAGAMKRHNFAGLRASHGVSISHRSHGSTGHCQEPGKVFKGKKMAGHMGARTVTTQSLKVVRIDAESNCMLIRGAVPGSKGALVSIRAALKKS